jgi:hypothetical protein
MHLHNTVPVVLYGHKPVTLTGREEHRLVVLENRELRRLSGPNREEVTGEW